MSEDVQGTGTSAPASPPPHGPLAPEATPLRWAVLACVAVMPIGVHVCYKMTSGLEKHLIHDAFEPRIDHAEYGLLNSAVSWVNLVLPFATGSLIDARSTRLTTTVSLVVALAGQLLFAVGVHVRSYTLALAGRFVFGAGEGTVMMAQGAACAQWFGGAELTLAIGVMEMTHNTANWLGKVAVNVGLALGGWQATLWFGVVLCFLGVLVNWVFCTIERRAELSSSGAFRKHSMPPCRGVWQLPASFWALTCLHLLVSNVEHLFDSVSANFIQDKWHTHTAKAAWLSSLNYAFAIFLSPLVGAALDRTGRRMLTAALGCAVMAGAHLLLGFTRLAPAVGLLMLSLPEAVMPTILRSSVVLVVRPSLVGLAFGVYEVSESTGKTVGAPLIGYFKDRTHNYQADELAFVCASLAASVLCLAISVIDRRKGGSLNAGPQERRSHLERFRRLEEDPDVVEIGVSGNPLAPLRTRTDG